MDSRDLRVTQNAYFFTFMVFWDKAEEIGASFLRHRWKHTGRQTDGETGRWTDRLIDRHDG